MSTKPYSEVQCLVKNEIDSIRRRDGELPPTAYLVVEVADRLKKIQPWDGFDPHKPLAQNIRGVVEEVIKGKRNPGHPKKEDLDADVIWISPDPYDRLEDSLGDTRKVGRSVDSDPFLAKKEKLKRRLKQAG